MTGFGGIEAALRMRDSIERIVRSVLTQERPESFFAEVLSIDFNNRRCFVAQRTQDTLLNAVEVRFGWELSPAEVRTANASGTVIEVSGKPGAYYMNRVISGGYKIDGKFVGYELDVVKDRTSKIEATPSQEIAGAVSGGTVNGNTNNVLVGSFTPAFTAGAAIIGKTRGYVKLNVNAWASGNEDSNWFLQISTNSGSTWSQIDNVYQHNMGSEQIPLGAVLMGWFQIPADPSVIRFRLLLNVGGGQPLKIGAHAWSLNCW